MSTPPPHDDSYEYEFEDDDLEPPRRSRSTVVKGVAGVAAAAVLAFGASTAVSKNNSSNSATGRAAPGGQMAGYGAPGRGGFGTPVTGATLTKLTPVVTAKYPGASIERANALPDGSYEVHVIQSNGTEIHALVSKDFKITGTQHGGPGPGGAPPSGQSAPSTATQS